MTLSVLVPVAITPAMLVETNISEDDYAEWAVGTNYLKDDRVIVVADHKVYQSLQGTVGSYNTGHTPVGDADDLWWIEVSKTNRWKAFDYSNSSQTVRTGTVQYKLTLGSPATGVGFNNVSAGSVRVRVISALGQVQYDQTKELDTPLRDSDWYSYFYAPCVIKSDTVFFDVPGHSTSVIEVTVDAGAGDAKVGTISFGAPIKIGKGVHYGAKTGILDYSVKQTNDFGDTNLLVRAYAKRAEFQMIVDNADADAVQEQLTALRARPAVWVGLDDADYTRTIIYGYYKDYDFSITYASASTLNINIEGLT